MHLSGLAVEIIEALPRFARESNGGEGKSVGSDFALTTTGESAISGISRAKERLDNRMLERLRAELAEAGEDSKEAAVGEWTLHDLRRTATTGMAKLSITPHVIDRILNHVSGTIRGVAAVYNRHAYLDERKAALDAWSRYVESLVRPVEANIVQFVKAHS